MRRKPKPKPEATPVEVQVQPEVPHESWALKRLETYCLSSCRQWAEHAWMLGRAIWIARLKIKHARKKWGVWCREFLPGLSQTTIWRLMQLAENYPSVEALGGRTWTQALDEALGRPAPASVLKEDQPSGRGKPGGDAEADTTPKNGQPDDEKKASGKSGTVKPHQAEPAKAIVQIVDNLLGAIAELKEMTAAARSKSLAKIDKDALCKKLFALAEPCDWLLGQLKKKKKAA